MKENISIILIILAAGIGIWYMGEVIACGQYQDAPVGLFNRMHCAAFGDIE